MSGKKSNVVKLNLVHKASLDPNDLVDYYFEQLQEIISEWEDELYLDNCYSRLLEAIYWWDEFNES